VKILAYGMQIKNSHSSKGKFPRNVPDMYLGLNPQTPFAVKYMSHGMNRAIIAMIPETKAFQFL
jgi:hypothetical protein